MKIALCHLEISRGPEHKNIELLENAVRIAADNGAKWVVTPETAVQGYYFYKLKGIFVEHTVNLFHMGAVLKHGLQGLMCWSL